jgi:hypothetical protein
MRPKKRKQSRVLTSNEVGANQRSRLRAVQRIPKSRRAVNEAVDVWRRAVRWIQNFVTQSVGGRRG